MVTAPGLMEASFTARFTRSLYCWRNGREREVSGVTGGIVGKTRVGSRERIEA
jgi:hypothetical protein